jgi:hypothetical protein
VRATPLMFSATCAITSFAPVVSIGDALDAPASLFAFCHLFFYFRLVD